MRLNWPTLSNNNKISNTKTVSYSLNGSVEYQENYNRNNINSDLEDEEMVNIIKSLSNEPTDDMRRDRLRKIFALELEKKNTTFINLFEKVLNRMGSQVQENAIAQHKLNQQQIAERKTPQTDKELQLSNTLLEGNRYQLWAFVDMMVQSKTLIKKANGTLGHKSIFG